MDRASVLTLIVFGALFIGVVYVGSAPGYIYGTPEYHATFVGDELICIHDGNVEPTQPSYDLSETVTIDEVWFSYDSRAAAEYVYFDLNIYTQLIFRVNGVKVGETPLDLYLGPIDENSVRFWEDYIWLDYQPNLGQLDTGDIVRMEQRVNLIGSAQGVSIDESFRIGYCDVSITLDVPNYPPVADIGLQLSDVDPFWIAVNGNDCSDSDGVIVSYTWDFGDGSDAEVRTSPAVISHTYTEIGTYTVSLLIVDDVGATDTDTVEITIDDNELPLAIVQASPTTGTVPLTVSFTGTGTDPDGVIVSYEWDFGDAIGTSNEQNPTYVYTKSRIYHASLMVTDDVGGIAVDEVIITVNPTDPPPVTTFLVFDGRVLDVETIKGIPGAEIKLYAEKISGPFLSAVSSNLGKFEFQIDDSKDYGDYWLTIKAHNYTDAEYDIVIPGTAVFELEPAPFIEQAGDVAIIGIIILIVVMGVVFLFRFLGVI